mgnify:CR=1 FL=1
MASDFLTSRLKKGENAVGVMLGRGFYKVIPGTDRHQHAQADYGDLQLIAQIEVTYADGTKTVVATDETWKTAASPMVSSAPSGSTAPDSIPSVNAFLRLMPA